MAFGAQFKVKPKPLPGKMGGGFPSGRVQPKMAPMGGAPSMPMMPGAGAPSMMPGAGAPMKAPKPAPKLLPGMKPKK